MREAYRGLTEPGRHPAAVLMLEMPPGDVDVNVHPTKIEVRFKDSGRIHGLVMAVVRERLLGSDLTPLAVPVRSDNLDAARQDMQSRLAEFFKGSLAGSLPPLHRERAGVRGKHHSFQECSRNPRKFLPHSWLDYPYSHTRPSPHPDPLPPEGEGTSAPVSVSAPVSGGQVPSRTIQLHNSYLVAQTDEGMIIIDQHAACMSSGVFRVQASERLTGWLSLSYNPKDGEWKQAFADLTIGLVKNWRFQSLLNYDFFRKKIGNVDLYLIRHAGRFDLRFIWRSISKQFLVEFIPAF